MFPEGHSMNTERAASASGACKSEREKIFIHVRAIGKNEVYLNYIPCYFKSTHIDTISYNDHQHIESTTRF